MTMQACLFCGGDASDPAHVARCDGRQGRVEATVDDDWPDFPLPPASGVTPETLAASVAAAVTVEPNAATLRAAVLEHVRACGELGATDDEIQSALGLSGNTERPRRWELFRADLIYAHGHRVNARGRRCAVWLATSDPNDRRVADGHGRTESRSYGA